MSDDDTEEGGLASFLPLSPYSLDAQLPSGTRFVSVGRIRKTVNEYASHVTKVNWYATFRYATVAALERRLKAYDHEMASQANIDASIAYKQLRQRVASLLRLFKHVKHAAESNDLYKLQCLLEPLAVLSKFAASQSAELAPYLRLAMAYARFFKHHSDGANVVDCFRALPLVDMRAWQEQLSSVILVDGSKKQSPPALKTEMHDTQLAASIGGPKRANISIMHGPLRRYQ